MIVIQDISAVTIMLYTEFIDLSHLRKSSLRHILSKNKSLQYANELKNILFYIAEEFQCVSNGFCNGVIWVFLCNFSTKQRLHSLSIAPSLSFKFHSAAVERENLITCYCSGNVFLDASSHLNKRVCPSVRPSDHNPFFPNLRNCLFPI